METKQWREGDPRRSSGAAPGVGPLCSPSPGSPYCPLLLSDSSSLWVSHDVTSRPPLLTSPKPERGASWDPFGHLHSTTRCTCSSALG